jgi:hypothetical protein
LQVSQGPRAHCCCWSIDLSEIASEVKGTTFTDTAATNATNPAFTTAATPYSYTVSAVDPAGAESAPAPLTCWMYHDGVNNIPGDFSSTIQDFKDTTGDPQSGTMDISITSKSKWGYTQPHSGPPLAPSCALDINAFKYMTLDLKPTMFLSGPGIKAGTYILHTIGTSGQPGPYSVAPSQDLARTLITAQRTNMYKFSLMDPTGSSRNTYYVDNIGFTTH